MKKAHFLLWLGVGGILSYAIDEFLRIGGLDSRINYFIWAGFIATGGAITAKQNKKQQQQLTILPQEIFLSDS